jgi:hypothetical protein
LGGIDAHFRVVSTDHWVGRGSPFIILEGRADWDISEVRGEIG